MFKIILYQPEIAPNCGNIIRLAANCGAELHLIKPYGFDWDNRRLRRAGLDYHQFAHIRHYDDFGQFRQHNAQTRLWAMTTKAPQDYRQQCFDAEDGFLFGPETRGLPADLLEQIGSQQQLRIPMIADSRSLNITNSVAVIVYEAWRQHHFLGGG